MVILNALIGVILKIPSVYTSIFDLVFFITALHDASLQSLSLTLPSYNLIKICSNDPSCFMVDKFANIFYLISLSIYFVFFYHFDKNFRSSFLRLFKLKS